MPDEIRAKISAAKMGHVVSAETRAKLSVKLSGIPTGNRQRLGQHCSAETKAKMSVAQTGHPYRGPEHQSPETVEKRAASNRGKLRSDASRARMSVAQKGHKVAPETRAKLSAVNMGKHPSSETLTKMSESHSNQSEETRAKISATLTGHVKWGPEHQTAETRAKIGASNKGRKPSLETLAKMSASRIGYKFSSKARAKMSTSHKGQKAWNEGTYWSEEYRMGKVGPLSPFWRGGLPVSKRKQKAKRRLLGFVPLNAPFTGCEGHHVDAERVIHLPKRLHHSVYHNHNTGRGMAAINVIAYNFLFKQEVEALLPRATLTVEQAEEVTS